MKKSSYKEAAYLFEECSVLEEIVLVANPKQPFESEEGSLKTLTKTQKVIGVCLLLVYLAMIAVTIATLPYFNSVASDSTFEEVMPPML